MISGPRIPTLAIALCCGMTALCVAESSPKRIYVAPDDHTDYVWSGDEEAYRQAIIQMLDYYLDLADATAGEAPEHQARWNCDGSFWVWTYERNKRPADLQRLITRIRDGHISIPLNALASCYGGTPTEAVLRGMYYAGSLERRFGLRLPLAIAMENQTLPYGLGALWAGAGARYSWKGICGCVTKLDKNVLRPHEIYWWQGQDGSRILMKWNSLFQGSNQSVGGYAEAYNPVESIEFVDSDPRFQAAYPYPVIGLFGMGWDNLKTLTDEFLGAARTMTNADRKIIVSNTVDFFQDFEATHGTSLPVFSAAFGNEWDLYSASLAEVSARVRRAVEKLRGAEALATLVSLKWPEFLHGRESARDQAWMNLGLYWEHDWTADGGPLTRQARANWQRKLATGIESYIDTLHRDAEYALGSLIRKSSKNEQFYVFNALSWNRTDVADFLYEGTAPVYVIDLTTGAEAPSQLVRLSADGYNQPRQYLRILARDIPPVGYKVFEVRPGEGKRLPPAAAVAGKVLENAFYRLVVTEGGAITSLIDKTRGNREFAATMPSDGRSINDLGPGDGTLEIENPGPVSVTLKATALGPLAHTTRITLSLDSPRIDIRNEITENFGEKLTWNFAFNLRSPDVWHEEVGAVIRARLLSDRGHYSPTLSRVDWLTLNHFAAMSEGDGAGVTLSNSDCAFMKLGKSSTENGVSLLDVNTPLIQVLAGGQVDGPREGIPNQGGDVRFLQRFALQTHTRFSAPEAMKFSLESQNPMITGVVRGRGPYPEQSFSLLSISDPNVLLWSLKPAEEGIGQGLIARVWNLSSDIREFSIPLSTELASAKYATHIETDMQSMPVTTSRASAKISGSQMLTMRLLLRNQPEP